MSLGRVTLRNPPAAIGVALAVLLIGIPVRNREAPFDLDTMAAEPATGDISDTEAGGFFGAPLPGASPLDAQLVNRLKAAWGSPQP